MSDFTAEPIVGKRVDASLEQGDTLSISDSVAEAYGIEQRDKVRIEVGSVDREESRTVAIEAETFEEIIEWYEENR